MKLSALLVINAILAAAFGIGFIIAPVQLLARYGVAIDGGAVTVARLLGAAFIGFAAVTWHAREAPESPALRAIIFGMFLADVLGFGIALHSRLMGLGNALGWSTVAIYAVLAAGFGYFAFKKPEGAAAPSV